MEWGLKPLAVPGKRREMQSRAFMTRYLFKDTSSLTGCGVRANVIAGECPIYDAYDLIAEARSQMWMGWRLIYSGFQKALQAQATVNRRVYSIESGHVNLEAQIHYFRCHLHLLRLSSIHDPDTPTLRIRCHTLIRYLAVHEIGKTKAMMMLLFQMFLSPCTGPLDLALRTIRRGRIYRRS
jgi:hypothetical protein